ncbi:MAG TPA: hypothetical protein PLF13_14555 [candidate division Zixibacteria bacterium]|nr:hypothetical protein [candidate division Zixibacteria bacterium]
MDITSSLLRKAAEFHKTTDGERCIRGMARHKMGIRFVTPSAYKLLEPEDIAKTFTRCPVCGRVFDD